MEWLKSLIKKHTGDDGAFNAEAFQTEFTKTEFPKYAVPKEDYNTKVKELKAANSTITDLKGSTAGNEELQGKIKTYETDVAKLNAELASERLDNALKIGLLESGVKDVDYISYKIKEGAEDLSLDDNGKVKGLDNLIKDQKTEHPEFFKEASKRKYEDGKLPEGDDPDNGGITQEAFDKMGYNERNKLYREQPEVYKALTGNNE
ncbi:phage scaffolding protein [Eubacterium sp.]|uniref:phage scaffolding protein n=1 Tax=Eubacterium sp. TaxID=142586 RepID=UPI002FCA347C